MSVRPYHSARKCYTDSGASDLRCSYPRRPEHKSFDCAGQIILSTIVIISAAEKARNDSVRMLPRALTLKLSATMEISSGASTIVTMSYCPCVQNSSFTVTPKVSAICWKASALFGESFALRIFGAVIFQLDGGIYRFAAGYSLAPAFLKIERQTLISPGRGTVVGRAAMTRRVARIDDALADPLCERGRQVEGNRSMIGVPVLRDGEPVVVIGLGRRRFDPFGKREIELATTFAAQALIAIENARLVSDLRDSLQQQTATADVLKVINRSIFDLQTVLDTLVESAARLCNAERTLIYRPKDGELSSCCELRVSERVQGVHVEESAPTGSRFGSRANCARENGHPGYGYLGRP